MPWMAVVIKVVPLLCNSLVDVQWTLYIIHVCCLLVHVCVRCVFVFVCVRDSVCVLLDIADAGS